MNRKTVTNAELIDALRTDTVRSVAARYGMSRAAIYNRAANDAALYAALGTPPEHGGRWRGSRQGNAERERQIRAYAAIGYTPRQISAALGVTVGTARWWLRKIRSEGE